MLQPYDNGRNSYVTAYRDSLYNAGHGGHQMFQQFTRYERARIQQSFRSGGYQHDIDIDRTRVESWQRSFQQLPSAMTNPYLPQYGGFNETLDYRRYERTLVHHSVRSGREQYDYDLDHLRLASRQRSQWQPTYNTSTGQYGRSNDALDFLRYAPEYDYTPSRGQVCRSSRRQYIESDSDSEDDDLNRAFRQLRLM